MYAQSWGIVPNRHDAFLREISGEYSNSETGHVEAPNGWNGLISISSVDIARYAEEHGENLDDFKPGVYIVQINEQGIVWGHCYSTWAAASHDFALLEAAFAEWDES
jgi:hypothetical protein